MRAWILAAALLAGCTGPATTCDSWHQWGNGPGHDGESCVDGQALDERVGDLVYDPYVVQEVTDAQGDLVIHYQAPLLDGDDVYMMAKGGTYTPCDVVDNVPACFEDTEMFRLNTQVWSERLYKWDGDGHLYQKWQFDSDWKPEPLLGFEPMFQPVLDGGTIAVPGAGGSLWVLDRETGDVLRHITPFGDATDPDTYVASGLAIAPDGTIYYNALELDHLHPYGFGTMFPAHSWLVAVGAGGGVRTVDYATVVPGAPDPDAPCTGAYQYGVDPQPWPRIIGGLLPPFPVPCGAQRPGINGTPAIGADGTIYVTTRAHDDEHYSYIVALAPDLTTKWATSLRGLVNDGCGVTLPIDGDPTKPATFGDCAIGSPMGIDPQTAEAPALQVDDNSSSTPVVLPDGGVLYGAYSGYNRFRGHLVKLAADGTFEHTYDFGWDTTPTVVGTGPDYKIVLKDNFYGQDATGVDLGPYYVTELEPDLGVVWHFKSTNTQSCVRQADGSIRCTPDHPHGFEWCINAAAADASGVVYANSEDGTIYAIDPEGSLRDSMFLDTAIGAAYTPVTLDEHGRVFALNSGHLVVVGN